MWPDHSKKALAAKDFFDDDRHAMLWIGQALFRIPQMMGHELQEQRLWGWPGEGFAGGSKRLCPQIGEIRGEGA